MYSLEALKFVKKDGVIAQLYIQFISKCFAIFTVAPCPRCGKSVISIHTEHTVAGADAYFICHRCGKRWKKILLRHGKGQSYRMKQYFATTFYDRKNREYRGLVLAENKYLFVFKDRLQVVSGEEAKQYRQVK